MLHNNSYKPAMPRPTVSLMQMSALQRLAWAAAGCAVVWGATAWALLS